MFHTCLRLITGRPLITTTTIALAAVALAVAQDPTAPTPSAKAPAVVPNPDYATVTSHLEPDGRAYMYLDLDGALEVIISSFEPMLASSPVPALNEVPEIIRRVVKTTGLSEMSDYGVSIVDLEGGIRRMKSFLHVNKQEGLLALSGGKPGQLNALDYVPSDVVLSYVSNMNLHDLKSIAEQLGQDIKGTQGREAVLDFLKSTATKIGEDPQRLLRSTGNECAAWIRVDPNVTLQIGPFTVPDIGVLMMVKVNDRTLFDYTRERLTVGGAQTSEVSGIDGLDASLQVNIPDNPFKFRPVVAQTDGWFIVATSSGELQRALDAKKTGNDVRKSAVYQKLAAGLPTAINGHFFIDPRFAAELLKGYQQVEKLGGAAAVGGASFLGSHAKNLEGYAGIVSVRVNAPDGILEISQGQISRAQLFQTSMASAATVGVLAAIAVPNFLEAQVRAKVSRVRNDQRSMATAIEAYFIDNSAYPPSSDRAGETLVTSSDGKPISSFAGSILTTPIAYMTSYFEDPFSDNKSTFGYYNPKPSDKGWILFSPGPDGKYDLDWKVYDPETVQPSPELRGGYTFDPTNGTVSAGDVWRVKQ